MIVKALFLVMITAWIAGAIASLVTGRGVIARSVTALGACVGSAACLLLGVTALVTGQSLTLNSTRLLPVSGLMLRLDGLGAFFAANGRGDAQPAAACARFAGDGVQRVDVSDRLGGDVTVGLLAGVDRTRQDGDCARRRLVHRHDARRIRRANGDVPADGGRRSDDFI